MFFFVFFVSYFLSKISLGFDISCRLFPENRIFNALPGVLGNRGIRPFISGEQKSKTEGNRGIKAILGNRVHRKSRFWFWGTRENADFF